MSTLFAQGWKAENVCDDVRAHHMATQSVYTLKRNGRVTICHSAPYKNPADQVAIAEDQFTVRLYTVDEYYPNGGVASSTTRSKGTFSTWDGALAFAHNLADSL